MTNPIQQHIEGLIGSSVALPVSLTMASGVVAVPEGAPWWGGYVLTAFVTCLPVILSFLLKRRKKDGE